MLASAMYDELQRQDSKSLQLMSPSLVELHGAHCTLTLTAFVERQGCGLVCQWPERCQNKQWQPESDESLNPLGGASSSRRVEHRLA